MDAWLLSFQIGFSLAWFHGPTIYHLALFESKPFRFLCMKIIDEKLEHLDLAIFSGSSRAELRGYIVDIREHLAAEG